jgi:hypothetical protein
MKSSWAISYVNMEYIYISEIVSASTINSFHINTAILCLAGNRLVGWLVR